MCCADVWTEPDTAVNKDAAVCWQVSKVAAQCKVTNMEQLLQAPWLYGELRQELLLMNHTGVITNWM